MPQHERPPGPADSPADAPAIALDDAPVEPAPAPPPGDEPAAPARRSGRTGWVVATAVVVGAALVAVGMSRSGSTPPPSPSATPSPSASTPVAPVRPSGTRAALSAGSTVGSAAYAVPRGAVVVAPGGSDSGTGSGGSPVRTLQRALELVPDGGTVVLHGGTYHQGGLSITRPVTVQSWPGEAVWFDGARLVNGFRRTGSTWSLSGWTPAFDHSPTYRAGAADGAAPPWRWIDPAYPMAAYPDMVWIDGVPQKQVRTAAQVVPGTFAVDTRHHVLHLGTDPTGHRVEASDLQQFAVIRSAGVTLRGFGVRRYATSVPQMGALTVYGEGATLESLVVDDNATQGIGIGTTGVTLRHVTANGNGLLGVQAVYADGLVLDGVRAEHDDSEHFEPVPNAGGIKVTRTRGLTLRNSVVSHNLAQGFWADESCYGMTIVGDDIIGNAAAGIITEISDTGIIANNVVTDNGDDGLRVADTGNLQIWNNTFARDKRDIDITQDDRSQSNLGVAGHDPRQSLPDPTVPWLTSSITLRNNVLDSASGNALLGVEDFTLTRTAEQMGVSADHDGYARASTLSPLWLVVWSAGSTNNGDPFVFDTLADFRAATHQEAHGQETTSVGDGGITAFPTLVPAPLPRSVAAAVRNPVGATHVGAWS